MPKKELNICFVVGSSPEFLGGISLFHHNLIKYIQSKTPEVNLTWIYKGRENKEFLKKGISYFEIKTPRVPFINDIIFNIKLLLLFKKKYFKVISSNAIWSYWMKFYRKKKGQKIIQTYHGTSYHVFRNHQKRFSLIKKLSLFPILIFSFLIEKPPIKKSDEIICISDKVKKQIINLYGKKRNIEVIRTGVDTSKFKIRGKKISRIKINLDTNKIYGLYIGRGGYWTKGLDRVIKLSKEIYKLDKNYRLLLVGADKNKVKHLIKDKFIELLPTQKREKIPLYYNSADIFFCMSRYEGGAPTLVVSESMASGCLVVCSEDSEQEIIMDGKNGLIITEKYPFEAKRILETIKTQKIKTKLIQSSLKKIKEISLDKWGEKYMGILLR